MILRSAAIACAMLPLAALQEGGGAQPANVKGAAAPAAKAQAPGASLGAGNVEKFAKAVRNYYGFKVKLLPAQGKKELDKLVEEAGKVAKAQKLADPLVALDDWREIVRRALAAEKPTVNISWRTDLRLATLTEEQTPPAFRSNTDVKELQGVYDNKLKAFVSVPGDFTKVAYPLIIGLHPVEPENRVLKEMKKSKQIVAEAEQWAKASYSKELLSSAIVIVPVMDFAQRGTDGVAFVRPQWDSEVGLHCVFSGVVKEIVTKNLNFDPRRIYLDGQGAGAIAALTYCSQFPGLTTGCIVRNIVPEKMQFENCVGTPILLLGKATQPLYDEWKGKEGFLLELPTERKMVAGPDGVEREESMPKESLDDATLVKWMTDHPKVFEPKILMLRADRFPDHANSYWLSVTEEDSAKEGVPIVVDAVIDREKNQISVVTNERVKRFEIFLNDEMLDLSKEVRVLHRRAGEGDAAVETERFKGTVKRSIVDMLEWAYNGHTNAGDVYVALITVELN